MSSYYEDSARGRLDGLLDPGSFREILPPTERMVSPHLRQLDTPAAFDDGIVVGEGRLAGRRVLVAAQEGGFMGGAVGEVHSAKLTGLLERALDTRPDGVLLLVESGGVRLYEANAGLIAVSEVMRAVLAVRAAGIPVIVLDGGTFGCFGGMGIVSRLCDAVVMSEEGRLGLSGPEVIETTMGVEEFDSRDRALVWRTVGGKHRSGPLLPVGVDAQVAATPGHPRLLVLVLGETGRAGNFGVNGYPRDTTPELARAQVASFRNAWSCGTSTAASVPCMFSSLTRDAFLDRDRDSENLLDVLQRSGLAVLWIDNQPGGCKGVCDRVPHVNTSGLDDPKYCAGGECHDEVLLAGLDERLAALPADKRAKGVVLVMHQMGSHGPAYSKRTPAAFKRFLPECTSANLPDCSAQELLNAYDNTIAYTDHVLGSAIAWLRTRGDYDGALLYVADHGESLGENNLYLHGLPYALAPDVQKHVPWITWLSPGFEQRSGLTLQCLRAHADARVTHDNLFHSVLGLMQVSTSAYQRGLDAYAGCAAP